MTTTIAKISDNSGSYTIRISGKFSLNQIKIWLKNTNALSKKAIREMTIDTILSSYSDEDQLVEDFDFGSYENGIFYPYNN